MTNSFLSSIPLYCMGFYWLQGGVHKKMDSIRSTFLWQGAEDKFSYHMAKFEMVCRPKDQGGLKIFQEPDELWFRIVKDKYMDEGGFFESKSKGVSQFWQGLHKVKHLFKWGAVFQVRNGKQCKFWKDCWAQEVPLSIAYENVLKMVSDPLCSVAEC